MKKTILLFIAPVLLFISPAFAQHKIKAADAKNHIAHNDTVTGKVFFIKTNDNATYINIDGNYPDNPFTVVVLAKDMKAVGDVSQYKDKTIEVIGVITDHKGKPEIVITNAKQLKLVK